MRKILSVKLKKNKVPFDTACLCTLFSFSIIAPYQFYIIKIALLAMIFILFMTKNALHKSLYSKIGGSWALIFIVSNLFFLVLGEFYGNQSFKYYFTTEFLWFFLYSLIFLYIDSNQFFIILRVLIISAIIVLFLGIFAFIQFNFTGNKNLLGFQSVFRPGYPFLAIAGGSVTSIIFFGTLLLLFGICKLTPRWSLIPLLIFIIATSRRSLMLIFILAPLFYLLFFFLFVGNRNERKIIQEILKVVVLSLVLIIAGLICLDIFSEEFNLNEFVEFFLRAFKLTQSIEKNIDNSSYERAKQAVALINGWKEHMIFGNGIAANASVVRSKTPGAYELTYLAILFQRGIVGFSIYILELLYLISYLIYYGVKYKKLRNFCFSLCSAFICFLIANGTNPYLEAFDHLFYIFIPFSVIKLINQDVKKFTENYEAYANRK